MAKPEQCGDEQVVYKGKIFEITHTPMKLGENVVNFEIARRAPGVRLLIVNEDKILLSKEYRAELGGYDYRLPGGKVFDRLDAYDTFRKSGEDILVPAKEAALREAREEVGVVPQKVTHIHTTSPTGTVDWTLYYFLVEDFIAHDEGQDLEAGEEIHPEWKTKEEVLQMCLSDEIKEERSVCVLLRYLLNKELNVF